MGIRGDLTGDLATAKEAIVTLNHSTGAVSTSANHLYGFANTSLYQIKNFSGGVGQILGAAYNGNFQI